MSDSDNLGSNAVTQSPPLDEHAGFLLRKRLFNNRAGFEVVLLEKRGRDPGEWFNIADFVVESSTTPPQPDDPMKGLKPLAFIRFQDGPIPEVGINGVQVEHLIDLCWMRLMLLGSMSERMDAETTAAIDNLKSAGLWLEQRRKRRMAAKVEGTMQETPLIPLKMDDEPESNFDGGGYDEVPTDNADQGTYKVDGPSPNEQL